MLRLRDIGNFLLLLPLLLIGLLHTDLGCHIVKKGIENEFSRRFGVKLEIGNFDFSFPHHLTLKNLTIEIDQDTHLSIYQSAINTSLTALIGGQFSDGIIELIDIQYKQLELHKLVVHLNYIEEDHQWRYTLNGDALNLGLVEAQGSLKFDGPEDNMIGTLSCDLPSLDILGPLFPSAALAGEGSINVSLQGPWRNPKLEGKLSIRRGSIEMLKSGALFKEISADGRFEEGQFILHALSAYDPHQGRLNATGSFEIDSERQFPFQVDLSLDKVELLNLPDAHCYLSGNLNFNGDLLGASMKGDLHANEAELYLTGGKSKGGHQLEITYINQPFEENPLREKAAARRDWPLNFDIHLSNNGTISISDDQLTSIWNGDLKLTGTAQSPLMHGDCRLKQGEYLFNGKKFKLTQGTITFNGDPGKKTQLYVVGEQEVASIHVEVILKGSLDDLALGFRSTPLLSEKEILCRLLFGRGTSEITPFQGAELTESINKLKNQSGGSPDILSRIKKSFGLDRIDISHGYGTDKEEISVQVGKYLSPSIFIGVTKGITAEGNRIGIEADLKNNLKFQAEIDDDAEGQVHLKWKHDY